MSNQHEAAAELRRLQAELERRKTMPMRYRRMEFNAQLQAENERLIAQRDALLQALKALMSIDAHSALTEDEADEINARARAAIKAVEDAK